MTLARTTPSSATGCTGWSSTSLVRQQRLKVYHWAYHTIAVKLRAIELELWWSGVDMRRGDVIVDYMGPVGAIALALQRTSCLHALCLPCSCL